MIFFYQYDSLQEFKPFEPFHMTQRIEHFFLNLTQRFGLVSKWLKELNRVSKWLQELNLFPQNDSKNFVLWIRLRIDFFDYDSQNGIVLCTLTFIIEPFFKIRPKGLNFFLIWFDPKDCFFSYESQNRTLFEHYWKNWTLLIRLKELEPLFLRMTQRLELF